MNKNLTAANEKEVLAMICNRRVAGEWQALSEQFGKTKADQMIASSHSASVKAVKAARYYW